MTRSIANEVSNKAIYAGTEAIVGTAVAPTYMWLGELDITKTQDLVDKAEATGGYFRRVTPKLGVISFAGTYAEDLTFESYPILNQYGLAGGDVATSDANTVPGYTYVQAPSHTIDDIESATLSTASTAWAGVPKASASPSTRSRSTPTTRMASGSGPGRSRSRARKRCRSSLTARSPAPRPRP